MRRFLVSALVAASLVVVVTPLTACGSGTRQAYSVAEAKAAFAAQGVSLHPFRLQSGKRPLGKWVYLVGKQPHVINVNVRLGPLTGIYKRVSNQNAALGREAKQYRNVLVVSRPQDQAVVTAALHRLK